MFLATASNSNSLRGFPRVCGDVSGGLNLKREETLLSPRMRGCFLFQVALLSFAPAFPAYAGMFLVSRRIQQIQRSFPRVCGDVSRRQRAVGQGPQLSPRMRGCFLIDTQAVRVLEAFPAYAGMFLSTYQAPVDFRSFPRVCGDVSWRTF